jgi:tubulin-specific chaperone A
MSQAEVLRSLKIKTNSLSRLHKELEYYVKEKDKEQARVDKMKVESADPHDIRQAVSAW